MADSPWPTIHEERKALLHDVEPLTDDQWNTSSLCEGWTVRQVLGHITATARINTVQFFPKLIGSGFRLSKMQEKDIARETEGTPADLVERFRQVLSLSSHPPGPPDTWLGEIVVHGEDIRRPLGITHVHPTGALERVADFFKKSNLIIGAKRRIDGLTLIATDAEWTHGNGPEVRGPLLSLVMSMTGRKAFIDDLDGKGVETLRTRP
jgi:uncharacterized protein (TIGR03083 family)